MKFRGVCLTMAAVFFVSMRAPASSESPSGFYFSVRGLDDQGTATYLSNSDSLNGWGLEGSMGWRFSSLLKMGFFGLYENLSLTDPTGAPIGPMNMIGAGGMLRLFFLPAIFIEGSGGETQARLTTSSTGHDLIANGTFYTVGPGLEFKMTDSVSLELSLRVRNVDFANNEFQNMRAVFYSAGLTAYFK